MRSRVGKQLILDSTFLLSTMFIDRELPTLALQLSTLNSQIRGRARGHRPYLSTIDYQRSTINYQLSTYQGLPMTVNPAQ
ncbi:MAG: hypothetical protein ACRC62_03060 [Microcoleus sp.]